MRSLLALLLLSPALAACDGQACTDIAVVSVSLEVRDGDDDALLEGAAVNFSIDGGPQRQPEYAEGGRFDLAYEEDGTFDVSVTAPGFERVERSYEVGLTEDGCHVEAVSDTVVLAREE